MAKLDEARAKFFAALARFEEALLQEDRSNPLLLDGTIQRFEFTIEMAWRLMKHAAAANGVDTFGPRPAFEAAFAMGLVEDDGAWIALLRDRNETAHTYSEAKAEELYARLPSHLATFKSFAERVAVWSPAGTGSPEAT